MPITPPTRDDVRIFPARDDFRAWLEEHHATADALFIGYYKKRVQKVAMTYVEAVEEALCYGWIDGITYRIDDELTATRFTPRRRTSSWSAMNVARVAELTAAGRMRPAGIRAFEERDRRRDATYSYEQAPGLLPDAMLARLRTDASAREAWDAERPSFRRQATFWITSAMRPETRERRFRELLEALRAGSRPRPFLVTRAERPGGRRPGPPRAGMKTDPRRRPDPMTTAQAPGVEITNPGAPHVDEVLTPEALSFVAQLHRSFDPRRQRLLGERRERQARFDAGELPDFLPNTRHVREDPDWRVAPAPSALDDRRVEITGPVEPKMMINALNSGARVFMGDFEDALSPTWPNVVTGQWAVREAVRGTLSVRTDEKAYELKPSGLATLVLRPRGWHLDEAHIVVDGAPISASLFDFGMAFFHNAREQLEGGSGPYYYLPKLESHLEAALWNDIFVAAQEALEVPQGSVRATVLVETVLAAFEMEEILHELRDHAAGLNAGRWDYIFSFIKKFRGRDDMILPDRAQVTMAVPFMRAYQQLLVATCHRRGAHAIGGMSAFIPNRREPEVTEKALSAVREDKRREAGDGSDGTWVAHPDLVPVAGEIFDAALGERPHQKDRSPDVSVGARDLLDVTIEGGAVTEGGVRTNASVALQYVAAWLDGNGAAAINNLMEDAATAEISRSQLWQWRVHRVELDDGRPMSAELYAAIRDEELARLQSAAPSFRWTDAAALLDDLVLDDEFTEFLTLPAYPLLG